MAVRGRRITPRTKAVSDDDGRNNNQGRERTPGSSPGKLPEQLCQNNSQRDSNQVDVGNRRSRRRRGP